jgi:hypothetical protein
LVPGDLSRRLDELRKVYVCKINLKWTLHLNRLPIAALFTLRKLMWLTTVDYLKAFNDAPSKQELSNV